MQRKGSVQVAVEAKDVAKALKKTTSLESAEEKVMRMRYGSKVDPAAPLQRHGEGNEELQDELLVLEMELHRAYRQHQKDQLRQRQTAATARPSREKEKIVRALRKKK